MPTLAVKVNFLSGGVPREGFFPPVYDAAASGATYQFKNTYATPNYLLDIVVTDNTQTGYLTHAIAASAGTPHTYAVAPAPPVAWSGQGNSVGGLVYYAALGGSLATFWDGSVNWSIFILDGSFAQLQPPANVWSQTIVCSERGDYPWGSDVSWVPATYSTRGGAQLSGTLVIKNGWKGKVNVNWAGLLFGGYGADSAGAGGKAGYVVTQAAFADGTGTAAPLPITQNLTYWERAPGAGADNVPAPYYYSLLINNTGVYSFSDRTIGDSANLHYWSMKQGDGDYQNYGGGASTMPAPKPWGLDFTTWTPTTPQFMNVSIYEEVPGGYDSSGRPEQLCVPVIGFGITWQPGATAHTGSGVTQSAELHEELHLLSLAWIDSSGGLRQALNPAPDTSSGWLAPVTLEAANVTNIGQCFLPNHLLVCAYDLSGATKIKATSKFNFGAAGDWATLAAPALSYPGWLSSGRAQEQAYTFGYSPAGGIVFSQSQDDAGKIWSASPLGASVSGCGGAWLADGYGCLYSDAGAAIYWLTTDIASSWLGQPGVNTGLSGTVCGCVRLENGVLVSLAWDGASKRCRALRSYDRGLTWAKDAADIAAIPALNTPPVLAANQGRVYVCWQVANVPANVLSRDCGLTWS